MLLSIGMIVKNEENHLRDCLAGIKPILDAVHSELIIYDTGSTDTTVEIAKEFTDNVHTIEWRNDFSWARNHTVKKAKGKWFMYVDADEMFTDVSDLISFFNSGEYKKYKSASYRWRNIFDDTTFGLFAPVRLFEMEKDTHFVGAVHESIEAKSPQKALQSIADHYGYYFVGEEGEKKKRQKQESYAALLLEELEQDPTNARTIILLAQNYQGSDTIKSIEYSLEGLKVLGDKDKGSIAYHVFNFMLMQGYYALKDYSSVINFAKKYLKKIEYNSITLVHIHYYYANSLMMKSDYANASSVAKEAIKYFKLNQQGKLKEELSSFCSIPWTHLEDFSVHAETLVYSATLGGDFDTALKYAQECGDINVFDLYMKVCKERGSWHDVPALYSYAQKCGAESDHYHNIQTIIENYCDNFEDKKEIAKTLSDTKSLNKNDDYLRLHLLRNADATTINDGGMFKYLECLDYFLKSDKSFTHHYGDVILFAMKWLTNFSNFAENMLITKSTRLMSRIISSNTDSHGILQRFIEMGRWDAYSIKINRLLSGLSSIAFEKTKNTLSENEKIAFFEMTMRLNHLYLSMVYKPEIYSAQNVTNLSENDAFVFCVGTAYQLKDLGDTLNYMRNLSTALTINPNMKDIIWLLVSQVKEEMEQLAN
ncbi:MAG: glycosyltransferase family 2 protein [Defluviitaleaceae bacterium]|nr:glycosyltransferase family 2 protein [Defluviitaleaceae bacterium]